MHPRIAPSTRPSAAASARAAGARWTSLCRTAVVAALTLAGVLSATGAALAAGWAGTSVAARCTIDASPSSATDAAGIDHVDDVFARSYVFGA